MSRVLLFLPQVVSLVLFVLALWFPVITIGSVLILFTLGWLYHLALFTYCSDAKVKVFNDMVKLYPFYLSQALKAFLPWMLLVVYFTRGWIDKTLGYKVDVLNFSHGKYMIDRADLLGGSTEEEAIGYFRNLTFTLKQQVARWLHWFFEDEEHFEDGVFSSRWVVELVYPKYDGSELTKFQQYMVYQYWAGSRNSLANFGTEVLSVMGLGLNDSNGYEYVTDTRVAKESETGGIGSRRQGYLHTRDIINGKSYPQFTLVTESKFITAGFGDSRGWFEDRYFHRFEVNNRRV